MEKYFIVFTIDYSTEEGRTLANRMDISDRHEHIKGFPSKSKLMLWFDENKPGLGSYQLLKPIS